MKYKALRIKLLFWYATSLSLILAVVGVMLYQKFYDFMWMFLPLSILLTAVISAIYIYIVTKEVTQDLSHEFKTPLAIMKGELELALKKTRSVEEYQKVLHSALEETNRMVSLAENFFRNRKNNLK